MIPFLALSGGKAWATVGIALAVVTVAGILLWRVYDAGGDAGRWRGGACDD